MVAAPSLFVPDFPPFPLLLCLRPNSFRKKFFILPRRRGEAWAEEEAGIGPFIVPSEAAPGSAVKEGRLSRNTEGSVRMEKVKVYAGSLSTREASETIHISAIMIGSSSLPGRYNLSIEH